MANIIIKGKTLMGKTRSEQETNLRKEWGETMTNEQLDKCKYAEKKARVASGSGKNFFGCEQLDRIAEKK
jgi:hypothetical protein